MCVRHTCTQKERKSIHVCVCVFIFLFKRPVVVYKPVLWKNLQHLCWSSWTFLYPPSIIIVRINRFFPSRTVQSTKCQCGPIWFFSTKWKSLKKIYKKQINIFDQNQNNHTHTSPPVYCCWLAGGDGVCFG